MEVFGIILEALGVLMVAFMALRVHHRVLSEKKLDSKVVQTMRREQMVAYLGVFLIILGTTIQIAAML